jgi:hypothetical protein
MKYPRNKFAQGVRKVSQGIMNFLWEKTQVVFFGKRPKFPEEKGTFPKEQ